MPVNQMIWGKGRISRGFDPRDPGLQEMWIDCSYRKAVDLVPALIGPKPTFEQAIEFLRPDPSGKRSARFFILYPGYFMLMDSYEAIHGDECLGEPLYPEDWPEEAAAIGPPLLQGTFCIPNESVREIHFDDSHLSHNFAASSQPRVDLFPLLFQFKCWKSWKNIYFYCQGKPLNRLGEVITVTAFPENHRC